jgi:hypothetical protein
MPEFLSGLLQDVAYAMTLPDADLNYLATLQQALVMKVREPRDQYVQSQGGQPMGMGGMGGGMPGMGMGGGMGGQMGPSGQPGPPGVRMGGSPINPDELRRTIAQAQVGGL